MVSRLASSTLAMRGAGNPDALAAYIASRSRSGTYDFAANEEFGGQGNIATCPSCGHSGSSSSFGIGPGGLDKSPEALRTPAPSTGGVRDGAPLTVRGAGSGSGPGLANEGQPAVELSARTRYPVTGPQDILVTRKPGGGAVIRHRRGGAQLGEIHQNEDGTWTAGQRDYQRQGNALQELIGTWNSGTTTLDHKGTFETQPLQPAPVQTPLMSQLGIPAIRALATPTVSSSDGPRVTSAAGGDPDDGKSSGLTPKGQSIKKKLLAKGWPDAKADKFARRAQSFGSS